MLCIFFEWLFDTLADSKKVSFFMLFKGYFFKKMDLIQKINFIVDFYKPLLDKYKGINFYLNNDEIIYIKFDPHFIPHALGLDKLNFFRLNKFSKKQIYDFLMGKKLKQKHFLSLKKIILKKIRCKLNAWIFIINFFKNNPKLETIKLSYKGSFCTHKYDFLISINNACLVLIKHRFKDNNSNFNSCSLMSIRNLFCFKKENEDIGLNLDNIVNNYKLHTK